MKYSILLIVPTLNSHELLRYLLLSLRQQSWQRWRILFIDGGSGSCHRQWLDSCCALDRRCLWINQVSSEVGIFGAMNQGFAFAETTDWLLFWGSDDWAADSNVFAELAAALQSSESHDCIPDLVVCRGRYADATVRSLSRPAMFCPARLLDSTDYRRALMFGSTPPHQATLFGPGARQRLASYASGFRLSADLDYFLQLSRHPGLRVQCLDLELVHMGDGGVSGQQTQRRLKEVRRAYRRAFGWCWWFPFLMRYVRRVASLLAWSR